ncbi:MAG: hypothetical protein QIT46_gp15 [Methanophagales virus PBV305]|uniref:Uncharacterized protein n=1 Tax=Methanophagales virus PBV305 TaxID=3071310 RepID=A0AA46YIQ2_9VIRU|nr:MAG: hypothetical protein QIT46_gp15 [Methanophagales virus PBV305]UYL65067.1 MAG: hypothetical protein HJKPNNFO_00015 [Methanophagales virus PBV305]
MMKEARVDIILQRIEEDIGEELEVHPKHVRRFGVNNIFTRVFGYLLGWKEDGKPVKLRATAAGALKTADVGAGLEQVEKKEGVATDTIGSAIEFSDTVSKVRLISEDYGFYFYPSTDGVTFHDSIYVKDNDDFYIDITCKAFKVKRSGSNDVQYRIEGYR